MSLKADLIMGAVAVGAPLLGLGAVKLWQLAAKKWGLPDNPELDDEIETAVEAVAKESVKEALAGKLDPAAEVGAVVAAEKERAAKAAASSIPNLAPAPYDPTKSEEKK